MNVITTAERASTSENVASPRDIETACPPRDFGTRPSLLSMEAESFLRDRYSTKLEDPKTGQWIRSWRTDGE